MAGNAPRVKMTALPLALLIACLAGAATANRAAAEPAATPAAEPTAPAPQPLPLADTRVFELRTYTAASGKLDALQARFRDHTTKLFERHGMTNIGYWVPVDNADNQLIYLLAFPDKATRDTCWKNFGADPEWLSVVKESEANGKLVSKVTSLFLTATEFSAGFPPSAPADAPRVFEMRTYIAMPDQLAALHARFKSATLQLFARHGMTNLGYFSLLPEQTGHKQTLVYFLAHKDAPAATASWNAFRSDPEWLTAKAASEKAAGGSLTIVDGIKSRFLLATDYSPIR
jgi:hypothetical protein